MSSLYTQETLLVKSSNLFYNNHMRLEQKIAKLLIKEQQTLSIAESCSGGLLTHRITNIPGSSNFLKLGLVTYSNDAKVKLLHVPKKLIKTYDAVSLPVAKQMAKNARKLMNSYWGIGITGIAGPSGGTPQRPVGLVFVAVANAKKTIVTKNLFKGNRQQIKSQAVTQALKMLLSALT